MDSMQTLSDSLPVFVLQNGRIYKPKLQGLDLTLLLVIPFIGDGPKLANFQRTHITIGWNMEAWSIMTLTPFWG